MILTGGNRSTGRQTCPSATLCITNNTWTDLGMNPGLRNSKSIFFSNRMLPDFQNGIAFWKVPRLRPFVLLVKSRHASCVRHSALTEHRNIITELVRLRTDIHV
jgi:hypothetical protein